MCDGTLNFTFFEKCKNEKHQSHVSRDDESVNNSLKKQE